MLSWMFQHDYLDTYCFECLKCICFVFLYLHLFSAIEHVSHGKALKKYAHYYYYYYYYYHHYYYYILQLRTSNSFVHYQLQCQPLSPRLHKNFPRFSSFAFPVSHQPSCLFRNHTSGGGTLHAEFLLSHTRIHTNPFTVSKKSKSNSVFYNVSPTRLEDQFTSQTSLSQDTRHRQR